MFFGISALLFVLGTIFWIWMLIVAATRERSTGDKILWVIIIIFTHVIGAAIYYFVRYKRIRA
jgi:phospholipase D-like protein